MAAPSNIPQNMEELIDSEATFRPDAMEAVRALARTKPWQGPFDQRFDNLSACLTALCKAYKMKPWQLTHVGSRTGCSGANRIVPRLKRVELTGHLSVVTMLHLFAKAREGARGAEEHARAMRWSATLFKRRFPISFQRCKLVGGLLVNVNRRED